MPRLTRLLLIAAAAGTVLGCSAVPPPSAPPSQGPPSATSTPAVYSPTPIPSPALDFGGYRWTRIDAAQFAGGSLEAVAVAPDGRIVGIGNWFTDIGPDGSPRHPAVWTSRDGLAWVRQADSAAFTSKRERWEEGVRDLVPTTDGFVAVGAETFDDASAADAAAWFSADGVTWARATVRDGVDRTMDEVIATQAGLVAFGEADYDFHAGFGAGTAIWTSPDGRVWTRVAEKVGPPPGTRLQFVVSRPGGFLATAIFEESQGSPDLPRPALRDGVWRSDDGIHWAPISGTPLGLRALIKTSIGYLAAGYLNAGAGPGSSSQLVAWSSTDGRIWTSATLPPPADLRSGEFDYVQGLAESPSGFVAFGGRDDTSTEVAWSSVDGTSWSIVDLGSSIDGAVIDQVVTIDDSLLLDAHVERNGGLEPVEWLLRR
jgi:hypothetical protein